MLMELTAAVLAACVLYYAGYVVLRAWGFGRLVCHPPREVLLPSVSVIVPARNEAEHLAACLHSLMQQSYPAHLYEVLVVNDQSTDATPGIARVFSVRHPGRIRVLDLPAGLPGSKKAAVSAGVSQAAGAIILQTDADCIVPPGWIASMAAQFQGRTVLVSGPVLAAAGPHWMEQLQSLELIGLTALGAGSIALGRPNLCNGANLAYLKSVFEAVGGFEGVDHFASGDDELLLQKIVRSQAGAVRFARCRSAIVQTAVQPGWKQLKAQRIRWVSKARHYLQRGVNLTQAVSYLAFWAFPVLAIFSLADARYGVLLAELLLLKAAADLPLMYRSAAFFHKLPLLRMLPLLELVYIPYVIWVGLAGNLARSYDWKGRMVQ